MASSCAVSRATEESASPNKSLEKKGKGKKEKKKKKEKKQKKEKEKKRKRVISDSTENEVVRERSKKKSKSLSEENGKIECGNDRGKSSEHQEERGLDQKKTANKQSDDKMRGGDQPHSRHKYYSDDKMIESSNLEFCTSEIDHSDTTLLLFYQYVEPPWDEKTYKLVLQQIEGLGSGLGGRMRVAREGLNCTLTGTHKDVSDFCKNLRHFHNGEFQETEFKLTRDLPMNQRFPILKIMPVNELVHYGLENEKAPPIHYSGVHLDPKDYHKKLAEDNTVVIDVRNHYEALIGHFDAPAEMLDPKMRKSTEFPVWLDKETTKEKLRGKQVLMYCTGGIRCERASALLKYKMDKDPDIKDLDIKGVYQLQGGIDKYFKEFPDGGFWSGKNYTFDKRFAHAPPKIDVQLHSQDKIVNEQKADIKANCEACGRKWDKFRGKRRCPSCGVPSLICKDCMEKHKSGECKLGKAIRCDLCVEQNITSKAQLRERERIDKTRYEMSLAKKGLLKLNNFDQSSANTLEDTPNPEGVTRLFLKNMCRKNMDEAMLRQTIAGITHIVWRSDRKSGQFLGQAWVEMSKPQDAARAVGMNGRLVLGRPLYVSYQPPDGKDLWPPPNSRVS